jgi:hypothetical protein
MSSSIGPKPYLLLSAICNEILSWMIGIWMKIYTVSDISCNIVVLQSSQNLQGMTNNVGLTFSVGDTIPPPFSISFEQRQLQLVTLNILFSVVTL